ncbi:restriction endonuclease subunit S [Derxia lacustris]|uniref:restriction endonuclease subunit S n=1 Tax=Derxia lacustris TaxID=764842 RepID=UPI0015930722|nr:restriction endonuclease subunit S [Derxia lacustris]
MYSAPGIVLSAVGARCGKTFKADGEWGVVANTHCLFPLKNASRDFLWYLTNQEDWWERGGTAQPFIKVSETLARTWIFPPHEEQAAIATFLDRETTKIDALIAEQEKLITLLAEKRQATISHAVTKGLDPNVPIKNSGEAWLGEVPAHWDIVRVKALSQFTTSGPRGWSERIAESGSLFIQSGDLNDSLGLELETAKRVNVGDDVEAARTRLNQGDVVICITGAKTGNVALCESLSEPAYVNQHLCLVRPSEHINGRFLALALKSRVGQTQMELSQYGLKQGLSLENIRELWVACPPRAEQQAIVDFLDSAINKLIALAQTAAAGVTLLQERRSALIAAAVTGQIDVRGVVNTSAAVPAEIAE